MGKGYRVLTLNIETDLSVAAAKPKTPLSRDETSAMGVVNSELPNPPVSTPLLSNESTSNEEAVGLHPVNPLIVLFELSAPYVVEPDTDT